MKPSSAVREYLDSRSLDYAVRQEHDSICTYHLRARGNTCGMTVQVTALDSEPALRVQVVGGIRCSVHTCTEVQRLLAWANSDDPFGMFIVPESKGEIAYAVAAEFVSGEVTPAAVGAVVEIAAARYDRLCAALLKVIWDYEKADAVIPVTETPIWHRVMGSMQDELGGVVFRKPQPQAPERVLLVGAVRLAYGTCGES